MDPIQPNPPPRNRVAATFRPRRNSQGTHSCFTWPRSNGPASGYQAGRLRLRGHVVTDAEGYYSFTTIYPGEYEGRTRHIHIRATSADGSRDVVTQLIMSKPGDRTPAANDSIARSLPPCHTMAFGTINGTSTAFFDFHL